MATEAVRVETDQLTVDLLVWRRYRRPIPGLVEQVLALNPGLAQHGPYIPRGTTVVFPIIEQPDLSPTSEVIALWD